MRGVLLCSFVLVAGAGCAALGRSQAEANHPMVKSLAAADLDCPADKITVSSHELPAPYKAYFQRASGCGKKGAYDCAAEYPGGRGPKAICRPLPRTPEDAIRVTALRSRHECVDVTIEAFEYEKEYRITGCGVTRQWRCDAHPSGEPGRYHCRVGGGGGLANAKPVRKVEYTP